MSFDIKNQDDVFKFAIPLHDYLCQSGRIKEAGALGHLVDACYPDDVKALEAHQEAYRQIRDTVHDLPPQYQLALDAALEVLTEK